MDPPIYGYPHTLELRCMDPDVWILQFMATPIHRRADVWTLRWSMTWVFFRLPRFQLMGRFLPSRQKIRRFFDAVIKQRAQYNCHAFPLHNCQQPPASLHRQNNQGFQILSDEMEFRIQNLEFRIQRFIISKYRVIQLRDDICFPAIFSLDYSSCQRQCKLLVFERTAETWGPHCSFESNVIPRTFLVAQMLVLVKC